MGNASVPAKAREGHVTTSSARALAVPSAHVLRSSDGAALKGFGIFGQEDGRKCQRRLYTVTNTGLRMKRQKSRPNRLEVERMSFRLR